MTSASHYSLLVVDDEPDLRTLYELTLLREGYDVETAGTVEDAWARLRDRTYSAVITDMKLPDGSGLALLRWLEQAGRPEKAVVITAFGSAENRMLALRRREVRDDLCEDAFVRRIGGVRGGDGLRQRDERLRRVGREVQHPREVPGLAQLEREGGETGEQRPQVGENGLVHVGCRHERIEHGHVGGDAVRRLRIRRPLTPRVDRHCRLGHLDDERSARLGHRGSNTQSTASQTGW